MLESAPVCVIIGTVLGFLSGLGIGGGSLLILWLTAVIQMPEESARMINLLFFLPAAFAACLFRIRQGKLPIRKAAPAIVSGMIAAAVASHAAAFIHEDLLRKLFGILLLITGIRELFYRRKNPK